MSSRCRRSPGSAGFSSRPGKTGNRSAVVAQPPSALKNNPTRGPAFVLKRSLFPFGKTTRIRLRRGGPAAPGNWFDPGPAASTLCRCAGPASRWTWCAFVSPPTSISPTPAGVGDPPLAPPAGALLAHPERQAEVVDSQQAGAQEASACTGATPGCGRDASGPRRAGAHGQGKPQQKEARYPQQHQRQVPGEQQGDRALFRVLDRKGRSARRASIR